MTKFHINKHGVPALCHAKKGNCPLGGDSGSDNHFNTAEEAQAHVDQENSSQYGLLGGGIIQLTLLKRFQLRLMTILKMKFSTKAQ